MPWYSPWSDHINNRVCKYLLQRYLGQFLKEKLTLDQLNVDLYKGIGIISNVSLDVQALNDLAEQQNIPLEFLDGFVGEMTVSIPWSAIFHDPAYIEVKGLSLTIKHKQIYKTRASMLESMWSSMSSSMQLAEECLKNEKKEGSGKEDENSTFEGIELFAQTIDSILSRIKVRFLDTKILLRESLYGGAFGVAFELHIKLMNYVDEAGLEPVEETKQDYQLPVFTSKKIFLEGVTIHSSEFSLSSRSTTDENESMQENKMGECPDGVILGRLSGRQEVTIKFKQEGMSGPKIELEVSLGAFTVFATPHQAHNILELICGVTETSERDFISEGKNHCPERKMNDSDFCKIEQELQANMNATNILQPKGLTDQGWANMSLDKSDDEFSPFTNSSKLNNSLISSTTSLTGSTSSIGSSKSSSYPSKQPVFWQKNPVHSGSNIDFDSSSVVFHYRVLLSSLAIILLHDDILTASSDSNEVNIARSSFEEMRRSAKDFFERLGQFAVVGYGHKDFAQAQELFSQACRRNHLRLLAAPVIIEGSETCTANVSVMRGICTAASLHARECLFDNDSASTKGNVEYVELLKFTRQGSDMREVKNVFELQPSLKLNFKLTNSTSNVQNSRKYSHPKSDFSFVLQPCDVEVDITIIDRISALLNKLSFFGARGVSNSGNHDGDQRKNEQSHIQHAVENHVPVNSRLDLHINSSFVTFNIRFPIPDFRPMHDMSRPPWWKRSIRSDVLQLDVSEFAFHTVIRTQETVFKFETQFRDAIAKFREGDSDKAIPFLKASVDSNTEGVTEYDQGFSRPRLVIHIFPNNKSNLEDHDIYAGYYKSSHGSAGQQSLITTLENTTKKEHSPFSCKKVVHESDTPHSKTSIPDETEGEELVIPGDKAEIADFIDIASINTRIKLDLYLPSASLVFPSKHMYEVLYNRISSDLLLWEPSAPAFSNYSHYSDFSHWSVNDMINNFHLCKSGIHSESDSDSDSQESSFYSAHEQKLRYRKKQLLQKNSYVGQSKIALHMNITQGLCDLFIPARDSQGNVIPGQHGQLHVNFDEGSLFLVSGYKGVPDLDYLCVQVNSFSVFHNGLISDALQKYAYLGSKVPAYLQQLVYSTEKCTSVDQSVGRRSSSGLDMLTVSVRVERKRPSHSLKMFRVAAGIRNATLRHIVCQGQTSWFTQLIDFFDVDDYPIAGHEPCSILTEINVHLYSCCVDYRPLYLPIRSLLTVGNFNISSNMAAQTNSSTLRFIAEEAAFYISDKTGSKIKYTPPDVRKDYVRLGEIGLFELSLRLCEKNQPHPKVDLRASGNVAHLWTCADSAKALTELLMYFASDGDFTMSESESEEFHREKIIVKNDEENILIKTNDGENSHSLSKSQVSLVVDMMEEAMKESKVEATDKKAGGVPKVIYFEPNEEILVNNSDPECASLGSELRKDSFTEPFCDFIEKDDSWENEYCILEHEAGLGILPKKGLPEVRNLTGKPVRLVDNHFSIPLGKADLLRSPKHYPKPVVRYLLREMSIVWHMYGGSDFGNGQSNNKQVKINQNVGKSGNEVSYSKNNGPNLRFHYETTVPESSCNVRWKERGGPKRRHDILMELQLNKIRFQHEVYPENTNEASRQVLLIQDMELRDRLASSTINKFLYQYTSEAKPKQSQAPMVIVKSVIMRSDPKLNAQECCLKVSLLPLRLNIDQDSILFLYSFFNELSGDFREEVDEETSPRVQATAQQTPIMSIATEGNKKEVPPETSNLLIELEEENGDKSKSKCKTKKKGFSISTKQPSPPLFFRCFIFSPDVPVKLDYQGKRVDMSHGPLAGILMGLGQLNNSELKLRKISYKHGLLGFDKLVNFVLTEWTNDIKKNQLPSLLGGVGPMHSLVQLIQGIRDLFWLPIEQYQRDGRFVRGIQRGANSFTTSTAMACLELTSRVIQLIQSTAETAYDMVSPGPSVKSRRRGNGKRRRHTQPADIREGVANAYLVVKEGIGETAQTIVRVASEEHEQKGVTGAVGGVLRQIPPTVVKPIILATEATNNVIGGMRSQLVPDARKEAVEKWRKQDL